MVVPVSHGLFEVGIVNQSAILLFCDIKAVFTALVTRSRLITMVSLGLPSLVPNTILSLFTPLLCSFCYVLRDCTLCTISSLLSSNDLSVPYLLQ